MVVAEEDVELTHEMLPGRIAGKQRLIESTLIEMGQEPVVQRNHASARSHLNPAIGRRDERTLRLPQTAWPMVAPLVSLSVEAVQEDSRGFDVNGMAHGEHAADTRRIRRGATERKTAAFPAAALGRLPERRGGS